MPRKILLGEMWRSEATGEVYIVTSFCKELFSSYACLRSVATCKSEGLREARVLRTAAGETLIGFRMAEIV